MKKIKILSKFITILSTFVLTCSSFSAMENKNQNNVKNNNFNHIIDLSKKNMSDNKSLLNKKRKKSNNDDENSLDKQEKQNNKKNMFEISKPNNDKNSLDIQQKQNNKKNMFATSKPNDNKNLLDIPQKQNNNEILKINDSEKNKQKPNNNKNLLDKQEKQNYDEILKINDSEKNIKNEKNKQKPNDNKNLLDMQEKQNYDEKDVKNDSKEILNNALNNFSVPYPEFFNHIKHYYSINEISNCNPISIEKIKQDKEFEKKRKFILKNINYYIKTFMILTVDTFNTYKFVKNCFDELDKYNIYNTLVENKSLNINETLDYAYFAKYVYAILEDTINEKNINLDNNITEKIYRLRNLIYLYIKNLDNLTAEIEKYFQKAYEDGLDSKYIADPSLSMIKHCLSCLIPNQEEGKGVHYFFSAMHDELFNSDENIVKGKFDENKIGSLPASSSLYNHLFFPLATFIFHLNEDFIFPNKKLYNEKNINTATIPIKKLYSIYDMKKLYSVIDEFKEILDFEMNIVNNCERYVEDYVKNIKKYNNKIDPSKLSHIKDATFYNYFIKRTYFSFKHIIEKLKNKIKQQDLEYNNLKNKSNNNITDNNTSPFNKMPSPNNIHLNNQKNNLINNLSLNDIINLVLNNLNNINIDNNQINDVLNIINNINSSLNIQNNINNQIGVDFNILNNFNDQKDNLIDLHLNYKVNEQKNNIINQLLNKLNNINIDNNIIDYVINNNRNIYYSLLKLESIIINSSFNKLNNINNQNNNKINLPNNLDITSPFNKMPSHNNMHHKQKDNKNDLYSHLNYEKYNSQDSDEEDEEDYEDKKDDRIILRLLPLNDTNEQKNNNNINLPNNLFNTSPFDQMPNNIPFNIQTDDKNDLYNPLKYVKYNSQDSNEKTELMLNEEDYEDEKDEKDDLKIKTFNQQDNDFPPINLSDFEYEQSTEDMHSLIRSFKIFYNEFKKTYDTIKNFKYNNHININNIDFIDNSTTYNKLYEQYNKLYSYSVVLDIFIKLANNFYNACDLTREKIYNKVKINNIIDSKINNEINTVNKKLAVAKKLIDNLKNLKNYFHNTIEKEFPLKDFYSNENFIEEILDDGQKILKEKLNGRVINKIKEYHNAISRFRTNTTKNPIAKKYNVLSTINNANKEFKFYLDNRLNLIKLAKSLSSRDNLSENELLEDVDTNQLITNIKEINKNITQLLNTESLKISKIDLNNNINDEIKVDDKMNNELKLNDKEYPQHTDKKDFNEKIAKKFTLKKLDSFFKQKNYNFDKIYEKFGQNKEDDQNVKNSQNIKDKQK